VDEPSEEVRAGAELIHHQRKLLWYSSTPTYCQQWRKLVGYDYSLHYCRHSSSTSLQESSGS